MFIKINVKINTILIIGTVVIRQIWAMGEVAPEAAIVANMSKFRFVNNNYKIIIIQNETNTKIFPFITDGESCYYMYCGTYFKMIRESVHKIRVV